MCGIAGIVTPDPEVARRAIAAMNAAQEHRGPDDGGEAFFQVGDLWLGLGNRRLSIIDRTELGHQPMLNPDTGDAVTFNGEIYSLAGLFLRRELASSGVRLRGRSDTEALLRFLERHEVADLARLDGMYAFAFYDASEGTLTLARDPAGIKPLYWAQTPDGVLFASEVRAILATGLVARQVDRGALAGYFAYGSVQEPRTIQEGVASLPAGTAMTLRIDDPQRTCVTTFWSPPENKPQRSADLAMEIRAALASEVKSHLTSDLPVGVFLSSGFDSTVIAGLAAQAGGRIRTFTVSVEPNDEESAARRTADLIGAEHQAVRLRTAEVAPWAIAWLDLMDQPSIDGLNTYIVSRAARDAGLVVAMCGQGGDELFGGYPSFRDVPYIHRRLAIASWFPRPMRRVAARMAAAGRHGVARQKALDLADSDGTLASVYFHRRRLMSNPQMRALGFELPQDGLTRDFVAPGGIPALKPEDPVASVARLEFATYLRSTLLRDSDAASMAVSLELRMPFLSRPMLDIMLSIPGPVLLPEDKPLKHLARQAFADVLRSELLSRPKRGFELPVGRWMSGPLRDECGRAMDSLKRADLVRGEGIDGIWAAFNREPLSPAWSRAWALVALARFLDR